MSTKNTENPTPTCGQLANWGRTVCGALAVGDNGQGMPACFAHGGRLVVGAPGGDWGLGEFEVGLLAWIAIDGAYKPKTERERECVQAFDKHAWLCEVSPGGLARISPKGCECLRGLDQAALLAAMALVLDDPDRES